MQLPLCPPETILTSTSACIRVCMCVWRDVMSLWRCVAHLHTHNSPVHPRECVRVKKHAIAHTPLANARIHTRERVRVCVYVPKIHHGLHLSPKAHEPHISWAPIMPLPTTTSETEPPDYAAAVRIQWLLSFTIPANSITIACRYYNHSRFTTLPSIYLSMSGKGLIWRENCLSNDHVT